MIKRTYRRYPRKEEKRTSEHICDHEGCNEPAFFKAPKDRTLKEYYWFCEKHIAEYNESWDYYRGLSDKEIEKEVYSSYVWDRPTYKFGSYSSNKDFSKAGNFFEFFLDIDGSLKNSKTYHTDRFSIPPNIAEALKIMDLKMPLDESILKSRYKELAKAHHPDLHSGNKESEELFKEISSAYQILLKFLT